MKKLSIIGLTILTVFLSGCTQSSPNEMKLLIANRIDEFINFNEVYNEIHNPSTDDIEEQSTYYIEDFVNYDIKDPKNVELEYKEHYESFQSLNLIKIYINMADNFDDDVYFELEEHPVTLHVVYSENTTKIDYYEYIEEMNIVKREYYILKNPDDVFEIEKYSETYDLETEKTVNIRRLHVKQDEFIEEIEYFPQTNLFMFIYNSYQSQEYFKYRAEFNKSLEYERETVEIYLDDYNSFVSYDIKEEMLEDYRIKVFEEGHRIVKLDVNVFKSKETITELTWNLLSVDGWEYVSELNNEFKVYLALGNTMDDYEISIQESGYGKVTAYKMWTGELTNNDISLTPYGLQSNITIADINEIHDAFVAIYEDEMSHYNFDVSGAYNYDQIEARFTTFNRTGILDNFISKYK